MTHWQIDYHAHDAEPTLRALSALLASGAAPHEVRWRERSDAQGDLLDGGDASPGHAPAGEQPPLRALQALPAGFTALAPTVALHASAHRFPRLHRMARALTADPARWQDALDPERLALERMAHEVKREIHKMHAFVRFRPLDGGDGAVRHVAWFEPVHHIVRAAAPFFVDRFAALPWAILTPRLSVQWDREALRFFTGAERSQAPPPDAGEALWLDYYRSIFNPARLKTGAMRREMPRRYWKNLPEAQAITGLVQQAPERSARMAAAQPDDAPRRRLPATKTRP